jgi:hypothetical protein
LDTSAIIDLLCSILGPVDGSDPGTTLAGLSPGDWDQLLNQVERHGLAPLFEHRLRSVCPGFPIPGEYSPRLKKAVHIGVGRSLRISDDLSRMLEMLAAAGIPVIVLKGAHLASLVYQRFEFRQMKDVDLLVSVADLQRTADILEQLGYAPVEEFDPRSIRGRAQHLPLFTRDGAVPVEVHWQIERPSSPYRVDLEGLWARAKPARVAGAGVRVFSPEDLLLHTCLHAAYHHRFIVSLQVFADVRAILERHGAELDWEAVAVRAGRWGAVRPVHLCLYLARMLTGAEVPAEWLRRLEPNGFHPDLVAAARQQVQRYTSDSPGIPRISRKHARLWGLEWPWGRPSFWLGRIFLSRRALSRKYPRAGEAGRSLLYYYPVRIRDLLLGIGRAAGRTRSGRGQRRESARREDALGRYLNS